MKHRTDPGADIATLARLVDCLDENEMANLAGVTLMTLKSWRCRGKGPSYVLLGSRFLYPREAVAKHLLTLVRERSGPSVRDLL